jgi:hypothetical protein
MVLRSTLIFLATNALGIAIFLFAVSNFWVEPELADVPGANVGSAFGWIAFAAPIPVVFILADVVWTATKSVRASWADRAEYICIGLVVLALWAAAYAVDNAHHGM